MSLPLAGSEERGLFRAAVGDGRPPLLATAAALVLAGGFYIFLAATGDLLPHDVRYLGMDAAELCRIADCRVTAFMLHDRAAFGGALCCVGILYGYLTLLPLKQGRAWAWWLMLLSGTVGFSSFLAYLSYGYLDTWHGIGTLALLPVFLIGIVHSRHLINPWRGPLSLIRDGHLPKPDLRGLGRAALLLGAGGTAIGGLVIFSVGVTDVFVQTDLEFMGLRADYLDAINPRLIPLIAHDRVGFGGAVFTTGLTALFCLWCAPLTRALWETMLAGGSLGLGAAIGTHFFVGYTNTQHLAPTAAAAASMIIGLTLTRLPQRP